MGLQRPGRKGKRKEPESRFFIGLRCVVSAVACLAGAALGGALGWFGGLALDMVLGYPMGKSGGFLSMGFLSIASLLLAPPLGAALGAFGGHSMMSGRGSFKAGLGALVLGAAPGLKLSLPEGGVMVHLFLLVPMGVAVGLELSHADHERRSSDSSGD
ncbi:hypothetical protein BO221_45435 [Archangium sp. Cb G35]|uniref:hypothetical protein n=1 Tax=Archangium sp. Cb G35 TaxID=1920190 RepID=UPI000935BAA8|nr:hypothetical protein [Archangium sp. Cb G35]OJT17365.1 hypothetical protein BO221_45435 [Archangium sp. Cb G35]